MSDIAFSVIVNNAGTDDIIFKTIMLKGEAGSSIQSIEKTSSFGLVDTYTIYLDDGTIGGTFTVTNGTLSAFDDALSDSSTNAVQNKVIKSALDAMELDVGFYDEITTEKDRADNTDFYISEIPLLDDDGNMIDVFLDHDTTRNPLEYAGHNHTTFTVNGNCSLLAGDGRYHHAISICNGVVTSSLSFEGLVPDTVLYIGLKRDRSIIEYKVNSSITPVEMLNDGCWNVFNCYFKLVENGEIIDIDHEELISDVTLDSTNPILAMGIKSNGNILFLACDGRTEINVGLTYRKVAQLLIDKGCNTVYNLDGGASLSMVIKGSKINRNIGDEGIGFRAIPYTINVKKQSESYGVLNAFEKIGIEKQLLIEQIIPYVNDVNSKLLFRFGNLLENGTDLSELLGGKFYSPNGTVSATLIDSPVTTRGFELYCLQHGGYDDQFFQILISNPPIECYTRIIRKSTSYDTQWNKEPTRTEIESLLNSISTLTSSINALTNRENKIAIAGGNTQTINYSGTNFCVCAWAVGTGYSGIDLVYAVNSSTTTVTSVQLAREGTGNAPSYSFDASRNLVITNNNSTTYMRGILTKV